MDWASIVTKIADIWCQPVNDRLCAGARSGDFDGFAGREFIYIADLANRRGSYISLPSTNRAARSLRKRAQLFSISCVHLSLLPFIFDTRRRGCLDVQNKSHSEAERIAGDVCFAQHDNDCL